MSANSVKSFRQIRSFKILGPRCSLQLCKLELELLGGSVFCSWCSPDKAGDRQQGPHFPGHADVASQRHSGLKKQRSVTHGDQLAHIGTWSKAGGKQALEGMTFTFSASDE